MKVSTPIRLIGTIVKALDEKSGKPADRRLKLVFEIGQPEPVVLLIPISTPEGQQMLSTVCRLSGIMKLTGAEQLKGRKLSLDLVQVKVQAGLVQPLICVGVTPC